MDIFFQDPSEAPLPPDEVRIRELRAEPWPDGTRVRIYLEVDPFQRRPNADITLFDASGQEAAATSIIGSMVRKMELTMHLRGGRKNGAYSATAVLYYPETPLEAPQEGEQPPPQVFKMVDERTVHFEIADTDRPPPEINV